MNRLYKYLIFSLFSFAANTTLAGDTLQLKPLEIGIVPYMSARVLISSYESMREYLELTLGKPVKIYTATGFKPFFQNSQQGDYDLVITAAHFARILQQDNNFVPLVRFSSGGRGLIMTNINSPIKTAQDLKDQVIALPDQLSLASIVCMTHLSEAGLKPDRDFKLLEVPSFASAILSIQKGEANAAVSAPGALVQMTKEMRESVRPVVDTGEYVNLIILSHPRLEKQLSEVISKALLKFGSSTIKGKQFLENTGFGSIIPVSSKDMNGLERYTSETRRLLNATQ